MVFAFHLTPVVPLLSPFVRSLRDLSCVILCGCKKEVLNWCEDKTENLSVIPLQSLNLVRICGFCDVISSFSSLDCH